MLKKEILIRLGDKLKLWKTFSYGARNIITSIKKEKEKDVEKKIPFRPRHRCCWCCWVLPDLIRLGLREADDEGEPMDGSKDGLEPLTPDWWWWCIKLLLLLLLLLCVGVCAFESVLGVGGSPLLHPIEQKMSPRRGKNGLPSSDVRHVWQQKQPSVACQCWPSWVIWPAANHIKRVNK